jgi:hypothetical protein
MVPTIWESVPRSAELPTFQKTLQAMPPPSTSTRLPGPVTRVDSAWKMKTA